MKWIISERPFTMAPKALEILKKGLAKFSKKNKRSKRRLECKALSKGTHLINWWLMSSGWITKQTLSTSNTSLMNLRQPAASDYKRGLARLDDGGKVIFKKLREWAGDLLIPVSMIWHRILIWFYLIFSEFFECFFELTSSNP
jgi:hypothetical protein